MNLLNATVVAILGNPEKKYNAWFVKVRINCYGRISETHVMFKSEEEANNLKLGAEVMV